MKTIMVFALCALSLTSCRCDLPEDDDKKKSESRIKADTLKMK
ncbi:hypothetical protein SAMN05421594_2671 [Chryseobacterium oleae]|uniref:Lipoprotein n=1 Tax=Chryseobacterium oleae TaxID=491207 RepID=A0A1I4YTH4_CHROL|nr:hypothetical protein SAMN05421594_2671 [Chryseobacterium oleae]